MFIYICQAPPHFQFTKKINDCNSEKIYLVVCGYLFVVCGCLLVVYSYLLVICSHLLVFCGRLMVVCDCLCLFVVVCCCLQSLHVAVATIWNFTNQVFTVFAKKKLNLFAIFCHSLILLYIYCLSEFFHYGDDDLAGGHLFLVWFLENFQVFKPTLLVFMHKKKQCLPTFYTVMQEVPIILLDL